MNRKLCNHPGCEKQALKGGVCVTHGAKVNRKLCNHPGCERQVVKGGVCVAHGAKVKLCERLGNATIDPNQFDDASDEEAPRVCMRCDRPGCERQAREGDVCVANGSMVKF